MGCVRAPSQAGQRGGGRWGHCKQCKVLSPQGRGVASGTASGHSHARHGGAAAVCVGALREGSKCQVGVVFTASGGKAAAPKQPASRPRRGAHGGAHAALKRRDGTRVCACPSACNSGGFSLRRRRPRLKPKHRGLGGDHGGHLRHVQHRAGGAARQPVHQRVVAAHHPLSPGVRLLAGRGGVAAARPLLLVCMQAPCRCFSGQP